jgi:hypothetical protein
MLKKISIRKTDYIPYLLKFTGSNWWYVKNKKKPSAIRQSARTVKANIITQRLICNL